MEEARLPPHVSSLVRTDLSLNPEFSRFAIGQMCGFENVETQNAAQGAKYQIVSEREVNP